MSSRIARPWLRRLALLAASCLLGAATAAAQAPTLKTINVDGDLSDWDEILTNPVQTTLDGDGSVVPCPYSTDRDCPVQSAGRDVRVFAWTYDATYVYVYLTRQGSANNDETFWFYMDVNRDRLMGSTDKVLRIRFNGNTGLTQNALYPYLPVAPGGDPMVDGTGHADGWNMPGDCNSTPLWSEGVPNGGSAAGDGFEERVPWTALGVPSGTGINFHVGSSNSPNPSNISNQVDDNLGGNDGGLGTLGFDLVAIAADRSGITAPATSIFYPAIITNTGSNSDSFQIKAASTLGLSVTIWADTNGDGVGDVRMGTDANGDGDFVDPGDSFSPTYDLNGDSYPDTPVLGQGQTFAIVIEVAARSGMQNRRDLTTVTTYLATKPTAVTDSIVETTDIGTFVLLSSQSKNTVAGQNVNYSIQVCNNGPADTFNLSDRSSSGNQVSLYSDPECDGVPNDFLAQDRDGNGTWDTVIAGDSDGDGDPDTGPLATGQCACFVVQIRMRAGAPLGTQDVTTMVATSANSFQLESVTLTSTVTPRLELFPSYTFATQTEKVSGAGTSVYFAETARNNWVVADQVDFAAVTPTNSQGWTVRIWSDPNGDGNISDGSVITRTVSIPPNGGTTSFITEVVIPAAVPNGTQDTTVVTGAAVLDLAGTRVTVTDELEVSSIATYSDNLFANATNFFAPCTTVYVKGTGLGRQRSDIYDLVYRDPAGNTVRFYDPFFPDAFGVATDSYALLSADPTGVWKIELRKDTLTIATINFTVEANGTILNLDTDRTAYPIAGQPISISDTLRNDNVAAPFTGSYVEYVVLDPTGTKYLLSGGTSTFQAYTGVELTHTTPVPTLNAGATFPDMFTVPNVTYPQEGVFRVVATWKSACGTILGGASHNFIVGVGEICNNGIDDDGDTLVDCADPSCALAPNCYESICNDGLDNDGDTLIDCADPDCAMSGSCPETNCNDGIDNDGNTLVDCADPACTTSPACHEAICNDGLDNDGDTLIDCADPDCAASGVCPETDCTNGVDDDGNTLVDCADPACATDPACREILCADGLDNDGDTLIDCADPDCTGQPGCGGEDCTDGIDNNGDTLIDCADPTCIGTPACVEALCADGLDNDGDTLIDCADPDCAAASNCHESNCTDTIDNDGDTLTDCADPDCARDPACLDSDGDTIIDPLDCAPLDPTAFRIPIEVALLNVVKPAPHSTDAALSWTDERPTTGTGTVSDVVTGLISELRADRGFPRASCLSQDQAAVTYTDSRSIAATRDCYYYLVEAQNVCGKGGFGNTSRGMARNIDPLLCN